MTDDLSRIAAALAGRYRIDRELGQGGTAVVYLAQDLKHQRQVALKVLRPDVAATVGPDRFQREIEIAARLQHPHVLPLYDSGEAGGFLYYVMPYVEGPTLRTRLLKEGGELPIPEVVRILRDMVDAVAAAHAIGVVHRDLKPENILLTGRHALVADFGVAKALSEAKGEQRLTTAGVALGTPAYMAPEQAAGEAQTDHRADIYALGVVGYEMLTGDPPFMRSNPRALLAAQVTEAPVPVTERRDTVPPGLASLVMRCLAKKPADRPQSAEELLPVLEGLALTPTAGIAPSAGLTPLAAQPGEVEPGRSTWRVLVRGTNRRLAVLAAVVTVFVLAVTGFLWAIKGRGAGAGDGTIAVLPFENLSGDTTQDVLAQGFAVELTNLLRKVPELRSTAFTNATVSAGDSIARTLGVAHLVQGTIRTGDERLLVNVQLVDSKGKVAWSEKYDRAQNARDIVGLQEDIARAILNALGIQLPPGQERLATGGTQNDEAYTAFIRGQELKVRYTNASCDSAAQYFLRATQLDPEFARAYSSLAFCSSEYGSGLGTTAKQALAQTSARHALQLDSTLAEPHVVLAALASRHGDSKNARKHLDAALLKDPADRWVRYERGLWFVRAGDLRSAVAEADSLLLYDPLSPANYYMPATILNYVGDYQRADSLAERGAKLDSLGYQAGPKWPFYWNRGYPQLMLGDFEHAAALFENVALSFGDSTPQAAAARGRANRDAILAVGAYQRSRTEADRQRAIAAVPQVQSWIPLREALLLRAEALDELYQFLHALPPEVLRFRLALLRSPDFDPLWRDPRVLALLEANDIPATMPR